MPEEKCRPGKKKTAPPRREVPLTSPEKLVIKEGDEEYRQPVAGQTKPDADPSSEDSG